MTSAAEVNTCRRLQRAVHHRPAERAAPIAARPAAIAPRRSPSGRETAAGTPARPAGQRHGTRRCIERASRARGPASPANLPVHGEEGAEGGRPPAGGTGSIRGSFMAEDPAWVRRGSTGCVLAVRPSSVAHLVAQIFGIADRSVHRQRTRPAPGRPPRRSRSRPARACARARISGSMQPCSTCRRPERARASATPVPTARTAVRGSPSSKTDDPEVGLEPAPRPVASLDVSSYNLAEPRAAGESRACAVRPEVLRDGRRGCSRSCIATCSARGPSFAVATSQRLLVYAPVAAAARSSSRRATSASARYRQRGCAQERPRCLPRHSSPSAAR